jgi:hypothetical protein
MKEFLHKLILFLIMGVLFVEGVSAFFIVTDLFLFNYPGKEIYFSILKSRKKSKAKKLLLGDSVGGQMFPNDKQYKGMNSLACNQAIGIVGHFLLLNNYLRAGNKIDTLIMLFNPFSFENNLDQVYTFHYFLKPFNTGKYTPLFTPEVKEQIKKVPYHYLCKVPHIYIKAWAPDFHSADERNFKFLSPISVEYLKKIKELSVDYDFKMILLSTPLCVEKERLLELDVEEFKNAGVEKEFTHYFDTLMVIDSTEFVDRTHLKEPEEYVKIYVKSILAGAVSE